MNLFGVVLMAPVLASMMVISVVQFGIITFLAPLGTIAIATLFLPLGFGNPYVARLVRNLRPSEGELLESFVVQLTRVPRLRSGLWAVLDNADDIGWLIFTNDTVVFNGDSVRLSVPYYEIHDLKRRNAGWRALFAYGAQVSFRIASMPNEGSFVFAERASWFLPSSRRISARMYQKFFERTQGQSSQAKSSKAGV